MNDVSHVAGRVIVGVHGSAGSLQALRFAVEYARTFGARLIPVIAWRPPGGDSAGRRYPPFLTDEWADAAEQRLMACFEEGLGGAPDNLEIQPRVIRGATGRVLSSVADRDSDLLVLGATHRGALHRALYGSPVHHCLDHARCTVITVPPSSLVLATRRRWSGRRLRRIPQDGAQVIDQQPRAATLTRKSQPD